MKKKTISMLLAALLAVVLTFGLAACGGSTTDSGNGSGTKSASGSENGDGSGDDAADGGEENGTDAEAAGDEYLLLKSTYTNYSAALCNKSEYAYILDENGLAKEKYYLLETIDEENNNSTLFLWINTYDDSGRAVAQTEYRGSDSSQIIYEYDESGNLISETSEYYEILYEYDEDGNKTTMSYYSSGIIIYSYEYDQDGNEIKYISYVNGECDSVTEYEYNEEGETVAQVITYEEDETVEQGEYRYTYDEDGNRTAGALYFDDILIEEYEYDEGGNFTSRIRYDSSGEIIIQYEYVYVTAEEYFLQQEDAAFDSCEELAEYVAEAIFGLDGEEILENLYDGVLPALRMSTRYSLEELAETLNEVFEDNFDDALEALEESDWEEYELSWEIEDTQVCPTEDYEMLMDQLQYPQFDQEDTYKMDLVLTVTLGTGETGEVLYVVYLVEEDGQWYIWMLDNAKM